MFRRFKAVLAIGSSFDDYHKRVKMNGMTSRRKGELGCENFSVFASPRIQAIA
jgi:hypothetical protein